MNTQRTQLSSRANLPAIRVHHHHPLHHSSSATPTSNSRRKVGVAVDLSDESAYAVSWAVKQYIRPGDAVILLHVSPTDVLFGADWGSSPASADDKQSHDDFDAFTASKAADVAKPLKEAGISFKVHIVKDHDMKERLCLEVERLGLSTLIMGSRGVGAVQRETDDKLGSVSDYCVNHCVCNVIVVRFPEETEAAIAVTGDDAAGGNTGAGSGPPEASKAGDAAVVLKETEGEEAVAKADAETGGEAEGAEKADAEAEGAKADAEAGAEGEADVNKEEKIKGIVFYRTTHVKLRMY